METPLFRREFEAEAKGMHGMEVKVLVRRVIAGIEAGKLEICPGPAAALRLMSRIAPDLLLHQMAAVFRP